MEPVNIVVQRLATESGERFRIVAYRGAEGFWPAEFASLESLVQALRAVMPDIDGCQIGLNQSKEAVSVIVWSGNITVSDADLEKVGLRKMQPRERDWRGLPWSR